MNLNRIYEPTLKYKAQLSLFLLLIFLAIILIYATLIAHNLITVSTRNLERSEINGINITHKLSNFINKYGQLIYKFELDRNDESFLQNTSITLNSVGKELEELRNKGIASSEIDSLQKKFLELIANGNSLVKLLKNDNNKKEDIAEISSKIDFNLAEIDKQIVLWNTRHINNYQDASRENDANLTHYFWIFIFFLVVSILIAIYSLVTLLRQRKVYGQMSEELYNHLPTGLPNLKQLREDFERFMRNSNGEPLYLMLIDIKATDLMEQTESEGDFNIAMSIMRDRIYECAKEELLQSGLYRYRAGMFALIGVDVSFDKVSKLCKNILSKLHAPIESGGQLIRVNPGIGVVAYPKNAENFDDLIHHGLIALTYCKSEELRNFIVFENDVENNRRQRLAVISRLRESLIHDNFEIVYQPRKDCKSGLLICIEAFIRWKVDEVTYPANYFLPLARESGLEIKFDLFVLDKIGKYWQSLRKQNLPELNLAINISAMSLQQEDFVKTINNWLHQYEIYPELLVFEVSKLNLPSYGSNSTLAIINNLEGLREMGLRIALDDFGTTQYAFADLIKFPLDIIKVDSQFVRNISKQYSPEQAHLDPQSAWTKALIDMSHQLGLIVVGEGVESLTQNSLLTLWGCDQLQGKFYCPVIEASKIPELINRNISKITVANQVKSEDRKIFANSHKNNKVIVDTVALDLVL